MVNKAAGSSFPVGEDDTKNYRDTLKAMYDWLKERTSGTQFMNFAQQVLYAILEADDKLGLYDKDLLIEYLKDPVMIYAGCSEHIRNTKSENRFD